MKHDRKPRSILTPICWVRGHRPEGESIVQMRCPDSNFIKQCSRCGHYIFRSSIGEMTLTEKVALDAKARYERALAFSPEETEAGHV